MDVVLAALPFVVFLACPVMMAVCFFGMRKMGDGASPATEGEAGVHLPEERIAALQRQLRAIQTELTTLQVQAQGLEGHTPQAPVGSEGQLVDVVSGAARATRRSA